MTVEGSPTSLDGLVKGIAHRTVRRRPMIESQSCIVRAGKGLVNEDRPQNKRQITLLSMEKWSAVCEELGEELSWLTRRANVLIEGADLSATVGKKIRIGSVLIHVHEETKPCALMDYLHKGLKEVMKPSCRGGVYAEVLADGTISVGDRFCVDGD